MTRSLKLIMCLFLIYTINCFDGSAQEWSNWIKLGSTSLIDLSISFKAGNNCSQTGGGGYSFWRTSNKTYHKGGSVFITFFYTDCDGRQQQGNTTVLLSETGIDESRGNWFLGNGTGVRDIRLQEIYLPEKKYWRKLINGVEVDMWKQKYGSTQTAEPSQAASPQVDEELRIRSEESALEEARKVALANQELKTRIRNELNEIPTPDQRAELRNAFSVLVNRYQDQDPAFTTVLEDFLSEMEEEATSINATISEFERKRSEREQETLELRDDANDIKQEQAAIAGGFGALAAGLFLLSDPEGDQFYYRGPSYKLGIKGGLGFRNQALGMTEYRTGTFLNRNNGQFSPINETEFVESTVGGFNLFLEGDAYPYYGDHLSVGLIGNIQYAYWPGTYDPSSSTVDGIINSYESIWEYQYGAEIAAGANVVKLLLSVRLAQSRLQSSSVSSMVISASNYESETETWHNEDQTWKTYWGLAGVRFGDPRTDRVSLDLGLTRWTTGKVNGLPTPYGFTDLFGDFKSVPWGLTSRFSSQSSFFCSIQWVKSPFIVDWENKLIYSSSKSAFEILIGKSLDFYGKPYSK